MSDPVICVDRLSKKYRLRHAQQEPYKSLRDVLMNGARSLGRRLTHPKRRSPDPNHEDFWALQDVSFEVKQGDRVGIIGRNGAGKSTLLKILSRIVEPTAGRIRIRGRVASLLEVGTGFHPELTGRENIYLNGAILGMGRAEIKRKFDEIVAFAEVEKFLDTPVKRYSSGMYVRLAFAVAAHLEPEILVVDEVLAVGDAQFQNKCLGKMQDVSQEGRTILFVSHNMAVLQKLCSRSILLQKGCLTLDSSTTDCIQKYYQDSDLGLEEGTSYLVRRDLLATLQRDDVCITDLKILSKSKQEADFICTGDFITLRIYYRTHPDFLNTSIAFVVSCKSDTGQEIFRLSNMPISGYKIDDLNLEGYVDLDIKDLPLTAGRYFIDISLARPMISFLYRLEEIIALEVYPKDIYGSGTALNRSHGLICIAHEWIHDRNASHQMAVLDSKVSI